MNKLFLINVESCLQLIHLLIENTPYKIQFQVFSVYHLLVLFHVQAKVKTQTFDTHALFKKIWS